LQQAVYLRRIIGVNGLLLGKFEGMIKAFGGDRFPIYIE